MDQLEIAEVYVLGHMINMAPPTRMFVRDEYVHSNGVLEEIYVHRIGGVNHPIRCCMEDACRISNTDSGASCA